MPLEAPGGICDVDHGLQYGEDSSAVRGELRAIMGSKDTGSIRPTQPARRRRCGVISVAGAAALWCLSAGAVSFLRWRRDTPGLRSSSVFGNGDERTGLIGLQRDVRGHPPRNLIDLDVVAEETKGGGGEREKEGEKSEEGEEEEKEEEEEDEDEDDGTEEGEDDDGLGCAPLYVSGLENCTEWKGENVIYSLLGLKREMLKGVLKVLEDPKSCGEDGDPSEPLLLVQELAVDEADAVVGAANPVYKGKATDAAGWSPDLGGMNRWLARYHKEVLKETRPVIVQVHGDDACALEIEVSPTARMIAVEGGPSYADLFTGGKDKAKKSEPWDDEDFTVPLALMTVGWDPAGDPTHHWNPSGRDTSCAIRLLNNQRVVVWFTSHTQPGSHPHPKFHYLPIGFGGWETRNGLPQSIYVDDARRRLRTMEECEFNMLGRYDLLFECNTLQRAPRKEIWHDMTAVHGGPIPVNHCPLPPDEMVGAASTGIFAVSPPGTGADCFRHYEMLVEGNIALVPDEDSLRSFMTGLPVFFLGKDVAWSELSCDRLLHIAGAVKATMVRDDDDNGLGLAYEKLTHGYWRNYIRTTVLSMPGSDAKAPYHRRTIKPLDSPGWETYRHVGCFDRKDGEGEVQSNEADEEQSAESCAKYCADRDDDLAATGFFGTTTDGKCWCGNDIGSLMSGDMCEQPVLCSDPDASDNCVYDGHDRSDVYVFGPADEPSEPIYYGCFFEHPRFLYHAEHKFDGAMTPELCGAFCNSLRYPFFGVERSSWCRCGTMSHYAGSSVRQPAWAEDAGPHLDFDEPDAATAAMPIPGATVGDSRFQCMNTCSGDTTRLGCGGDKAWDMYSVRRPCVLFGGCKEDDGDADSESGQRRR